MAESEEMMNNIIDEFCKQYKPCPAKEKEPIKMTSLQIQDILESIADEGSVSKKSIFDYLTAKGYKYQLDKEEKEFVWLLAK